MVAFVCPSCACVGGMVGGVLTGFFANPEIGGASGVFYGNGEQLGWQIASILMIIVCSVYSLLSYIYKCNYISIYIYVYIYIYSEIEKEDL